MRVPSDHATRAYEGGASPARSLSLSARDRSLRSSYVSSSRSGLRTGVSSSSSSSAPYASSASSRKGSRFGLSGLKMPKRADDVRFRLDCERETVPESETRGLRSRGVGASEGAAGPGVGGLESPEGGVGLVKLRPKGRRGMGRSMGGLWWSIVSGL